MVVEFIEGWDFIQILGEGSFAEVKLLVNRITGEACAMKEIDFRRHPEADKHIRKEICIHKLLKHPNIVQCYGSRREGLRQFIFLEYCNAGELFDRIEPKIGMLEANAQNFFQQLISGLDYLHRRGVAHRDIKPENILLMEGDILKISDLGMATVFRHQGDERLLERRCGTLPYLAPEVLIKSQYNAEPADIWSCGVVLVAMLTGELPWDQPTPCESEYMSWKEQEYGVDPWRKIDNLPLSLLRKILSPHPSRRYNLSQIRNHVWVKKRFRDADGNLLDLSLKFSSKRCRITKDVCFPENSYCAGDTGDRLTASQPVDAFKKLDQTSSTESKSNNFINLPGNAHAFTQPAQGFDNLLTEPTQSTPHTKSNLTRYHRLVKRMTRFWLKGTDIDKAQSIIVNVCLRMGYIVNVNTKGLLTIETHDRRGAALIFKASLFVVDKHVLNDFRLSRGCGLEFKSHFATIRKNIPGIVENAPIMWPCLIETKTIPGVPASHSID